MFIFAIYHTATKGYWRIFTSLSGSFSYFLIALQKKSYSLYFQWFIPSPDNYLKFSFKSNLGHQKITCIWPRKEKCRFFPDRRSKRSDEMLIWQLSDRESFDVTRIQIVLWIKDKQPLAQWDKLLINGGNDFTILSLL